MTTATAIANPNLAFIKYWGNRDNTPLGMGFRWHCPPGQVGLRRDTTADLQKITVKGYQEDETDTRATKEKRGISERIEDLSYGQDIVRVPLMIDC